jgi:hypothetical protein
LMKFKVGDRVRINEKGLKEFNKRNPDALLSNPTRAQFIREVDPEGRLMLRFPYFWFDQDMVEVAAEDVNEPSVQQLLRNVIVDACVRENVSLGPHRDHVLRVASLALVDFVAELLTSPKAVTALRDGLHTPEIYTGDQTLRGALSALVATTLDVGLLKETRASDRTVGELKSLLAVLPGVVRGEDVGSWHNKDIESALNDVAEVVQRNKPKWLWDGRETVVVMVEEFRFVLKYETGSASWFSVLVEMRDKDGMGETRWSDVPREQQTAPLKQLIRAVVMGEVALPRRT